MSGKLFFKWFFYLVLLILGCSTTAQARQSITQIEQAANQWLDQALGQEQGRYQARLSNLDPRLRLAACQSPLVVEVHGNKALRGRVNLKVSCLEQDWFIYLGADIARYLQVVVAATDLPRRSKLTSTRLKLAEKEVTRVRGDYYTQLAEVEGMQLRNRLRAGEILTSNNLLVADAVNRGEQIAIIATNGTLSVRMAGEALDSGKLGDQVRVKNLQSGRVIRALVVGRARVEVRY